MNLTKILAGLLVVLAIGLAFVAWMLGREPQRPVAPIAAASGEAAAKAEPAQMHDVVLIARPVAAGQRLTAEDLKLGQMPTPIVNSFAKTEAVLGRTTLIALPAEAPLFEQHLLHGLALQIEPGQRALSIAIKEQMAAGHHVRPGDFVDVFVTLEDKSGQTAADTHARLLLARSRVLAYGQASVENPPPTAAQAAQEEESSQRRGSSREREYQASRPENANTAVLAVPLEDVQRLALAEKYGQLTLALRHPDDTALPNPELFAALPSALRPLPGRLPKGEQMQAADKAFAGLRFKDLAATGTGAAPRQTGSAVRTQASPRPERQQSVELHQGAAVQRVSY
ncbi:Flp pilus assembly protein CpaB [Comamonas composti]|uniref:Flp pilus assembly protein CpaB n=1 Tax=Comamonas composti TaxID=408558 RepID=UPI00042A3881|nr:Flp pilus assembly protein CpaB [Comamonas composti]